MLRSSSFQTNSHICPYVRRWGAAGLILVAAQYVFCFDCFIGMVEMTSCFVIFLTSTRVFLFLQTIRDEGAGPNGWLRTTSDVRSFALVC
jgi:hypothetical protein